MKYHSVDFSVPWTGAKAQDAALLSHHAIQILGLSLPIDKMGLIGAWADGLASKVPGTQAYR